MSPYLSNNLKLFRPSRSSAAGLAAERPGASIPDPSERLKNIIDEDGAIAVGGESLVRTSVLRFK
jgi:hypothetical protein